MTKTLIGFVLGLLGGDIDLSDTYAEVARDSDSAHPSTCASLLPVTRWLGWQRTSERWMSSGSP